MHENLSIGSWLVAWVIVTLRVLLNPVRLLRRNIDIEHILEKMKHPHLKSVTVRQELGIFKNMKFA